MRVRGPAGRVRRAIAATAIGCAALGTWCGVASAGTLAFDPAVSPTATYTGDDGANALTVSGAAGTVHLADVLPIVISPPAPAGGCTAAGPTAADCPGATSVTASLGAGNDTLATGPGAPPLTFAGGNGNDTLVDPAPSPGTVMAASAGTNRADYSARTTPITVTMNGLAADDGAPGEGDNILADDLAAGSAGDTITGNGLPNSISAGAGDDVVSGDVGGDGIDGGAGNDTLRGDVGNDLLLGGDGADVLLGGSEGDVLVGGPGPDSMSGGAGDDTISAADGVAETVDCGAGRDTVVADLGAGGVRDTLIGCESVTGPSPPAGAPGPSGTQPALGVPGIVTVLAPGVATATDLTPPRATLRVTARQRLRTARIRGIRLRIGCAEACGISAALSINRTAAKRLGLAGRTGGAVLGTATARKSRAGALRLRVRLTRRARSALRRARRQTVTVQVLVSDASGNGTLLQHRIQLVR